MTLKAALSLDGMVAARRGARTALTGPEGNALVHQERAEVDAIAIGSETLLVDDPLLTARGVYRERPLTRVVFDRRLRTAPTARLFSTLDAGPIIIVGGAEAAGREGARRSALEAAGAQLERSDRAAEARVWPAQPRFSRRRSPGLPVADYVAHRRGWTSVA